MRPGSGFSLVRTSNPTDMRTHLLTAASLLSVAGLGFFNSPQSAAEGPGAARPEATEPIPVAPDRRSIACVAADTVESDPSFYRIDLRAPASSPGSRDAGGHVQVSHPPSPFGLTLDRDGRLVQRLRFVLDADFRMGTDGRLVAWVASPELDPVHRLGEIGPGASVSGEVTLNKFLVFVTDEPAGTVENDRWEGPVVLKGKSRSGRMQSMASHGMFEREPC